MCYFITSPHKKKQKRQFLLMELFISLTLLAFLLGALGLWYRRIYCLHKQQERAYASFLEDSRAYKQLRILFRDALSLSEDPGALFALTFDRGVYRDPELAGEVRAALHYNVDTHRLELRMYNLKNYQKMERHLLLSHVKNLTISSLGNIENQELPEKISLSITRELPKQNARTLHYVFSLGK